MRRAFMLVVAALMAFALVIPAAGASSYGTQTATYEVTITNLETGQPISPPVLATHDRGVRLFRLGGHASDAVEEIAENGNQSPAVAALLANPRVTDVVDVGMPLTPAGSAAGGFSDAVTVKITADRNDRLSLVGMLICTNDGIVGVDSTYLPRWGTKTVYAGAYDAGTERNTELSADIVDPCSGIGPVPLDGDPNGNNNDSVDTDRRIRRHRGVAADADLQPAHDFSRSVARVTITKVATTATYDVTLTNLASGQPLSPAVVATASPWVALQRPGWRAPSYIEAIAENGDQSEAVAYLNSRRGVTDVVDVGVPLTPAGSSAGGFADSVSFDIEARRGDRLSLASMLICSNDGFVAANRVKLPSSGTATYYLYAWDAGTERNTELSADIVDPCSGLGPVALDGDPNGNNNDGIDTNGRVRLHAGVKGTGDLSSAHDWAGPVVRLTITANSG